MVEKSSTQSTNKSLSKILPQMMRKIDSMVQDPPSRVLSIWPEIIGPRFAPQTEALSFEEGILTVKVRNSSLLSLLTQTEKPRLLKMLRKRLPKVEIKTLRFTIG